MNASPILSFFSVSFFKRLPPGREFQLNFKLVWLILLLELCKGLQTRWGAVEESMAQFHLSEWLWVSQGKQCCAYDKACRLANELLPAKCGGAAGWHSDDHMMISAFIGCAHPFASWLVWQRKETECAAPRDASSWHWSEFAQSYGCSSLWNPQAQNDIEI